MAAEGPSDRGVGIYHLALVRFVGGAIMICYSPRWLQWTKSAYVVVEYLIYPYEFSFLTKRFFYPAQNSLVINEPYQVSTVRRSLLIAADVQGYHTVLTFGMDYSKSIAIHTQNAYTRRWLFTDAWVRALVCVSVCNVCLDFFTFYFDFVWFCFAFLPF